MYFAIGVEPTKLTAAMSLWVNSASTASLSPWTTVKTPSGRPASFHIWARKSEPEGSFSLGFRMKALPQAMALAHIHRGTITGKLNGVMPATTPRGGQIHLGAHHPRRRVVDEGRSAGGAWGLAAADPVSDSLRHGCRLRAK